MNQRTSLLNSEILLSTFVRLGVAESEKMAAPPLPNLFFPPISPTNSTRSPKFYFPATTATAGARRATPFVASSAATVRSGGRVNPDDYHSTLRALNSKGRMPRKSLGQVRSSTPCLIDYLLVI